MKVLHLSAANESTGAGKATLLTHNALLQYGTKSRILFLKSDIDSYEVYSYHKLGVFAKLLQLFISFGERLPQKFYPRRESSIFSPGLIGLNLKNNKFIKWADIIHIHWANHGFINVKEIQSWKKPIVWTLRDMWAFTGGCHHAFFCESFKNKCGYCPELGSSSENDLSRYVLFRKMKYLSSLNINWIAISSWMQKQANESVLLKDKPVDIIHSGVNAKMFNLLEKMAIRKKLNLPLNKKIILLGADNIRSRYKGYDYAVNVLNMVNPDYFVITFGLESFQAGEIPQQTLHFGELGYNQLCELYNAADVFFGPSIAEAMGKTFIEAQLCGLPVVCFNETGPADIVKHKKTGYLANYKDVNDLLKGIEFCLQTEFDRQAMHSRIVENFDISVAAKKYIGIYEKCLQRNKN